ncbi:MAG: DUF4454 domain-containing protein, partial [Ruminococcus sp.]|nr:DUF4454 domain-containing protein [Ruminococcus sp.]
AFLTNAEANFDEASWKQNLADYQALSEPPYFSYLPDGEISIHLDSTQAEDMGIYYKASGRIAVPVTITEEEYRSLDNGTVLQLCINELTGETIKIKRSDETDSGNNNEQAPYLLVPEDGYSHDVNFTYQPETNTYTLWIFSDDTVFCTVYEGDIYVLKGAAEEYFYHFEHYENPLTERSGVYQIMTFDEEPSGFDMDYYYGNQPVFDEKGYLKALYFYGD